MASAFLYAVSYDLGFAPNPFGGLCSLACCKPNVRARAKEGDWVVGLTGTKIKPELRCVFAMTVTRIISFDDYWTGEEFNTRRAIRNGTPKKQVGDNIYHRDDAEVGWTQEDSVHSRVDGTQCPLNTAHDTRVNRILLSDQFVYFGDAAPAMPASVRKALAYHRNPRDYRRYDGAAMEPLIKWLGPQLTANRNAVLSDPIDFASTTKRFSSTLQRLIS